jgi:hypothetical protein
MKQVVEKKKGVTPEEGGDCKNEYTLIGIVVIGEISMSGSSQCKIYDATLMDKNSIELDLSGSTSLFLPPCQIERLDVSGSGCSYIRGNVTVDRLSVRCSGTSSVHQFHVNKSAKLKASGFASITVGVSPEAKVDKSKSGCTRIDVVDASFFV